MATPLCSEVQATSPPSRRSRRSSARSLCLVFLSTFLEIPPALPSWFSHLLLLLLLITLLHCNCHGVGSAPAPKGPRPRPRPFIRPSPQWPRSRWTPAPRPHIALPSPLSPGNAQNGVTTSLIIHCCLSGSMQSIMFWAAGARHLSSYIPVPGQMSIFTLVFRV